MSNDIRARFQSVHAIGRVRAGEGRSHTGATLSTLAGRIAGQISDCLGLADRGAGGQHEGKGRNLVLPADLYEVNREAEVLGAKLAAGPADLARLAQSLHAFAEACATLLAARPAAFSLERIVAIVDSEAARVGEVETVASARTAIEQASLAIERGQW